MKYNRSKNQIFGLALILAAVSGCVITTGVEIPDFVYPDSSFQAVVTVEVRDAWSSVYGYLGVLVPVGWDVNRVTYEKVQGSQPNSGSMFYYEDMEAGLEYFYPSGPWDHWIGFISDGSYSCGAGDIYEINVTINTDDIIGYVDIAFLGMGNGGYGWMWIGDPCSTTVEVVELNLEQSTWGAVKSEFRL